MMCKGSNNFRNGDYATANFFFIRKKIPILDKFIYVSAKKQVFCVRLAQIFR